jgi:Fe-S-cluster containining protein
MVSNLKHTAKTRDASFSYQCHACNKCCHGKGIQVNPYETMRLSNHLKITTTEFRSTYLNGQLLKQKQHSNACIFLDETGCTVHEDRPLACRLYPLGRLRIENGKEYFTEIGPHPDSAGEYGTNSTVDTYLKTQAVKPFLNAERIYMKLIQVMANTALLELQPKTKKKKKHEARLNYTEWTEQQIKLHIEELQAWVDKKWDPFQNI